MKIEIMKLTDEQKQELGINRWPIWTKEVSKFKWYYDSREKCQILEGYVIIHTDEGDVEIKAGDYVIFPKGLSCEWEVKEPVRKHYQFD